MKEDFKTMNNLLFEGVDKSKIDKGKQEAKEGQNENQSYFDKI